MSKQVQLSEETQLRFQLTSLEQDILNCLSSGLIAEEIANRLKQYQCYRDLTEETVKAQITNIMQKARGTAKIGAPTQIRWRLRRLALKAKRVIMSLMR